MYTPVEDSPSKSALTLGTHISVLRRRLVTTEEEALITGMEPPGMNWPVLNETNRSGATSIPPVLPSLNVASYQLG